jgi:hypothetical protein
LRPSVPFALSTFSVCGRSLRRRARAAIRAAAEPACGDSSGLLAGLPHRCAEEDVLRLRQEVEMTVDPVAYAAGLRVYAGSTLEARSLHCWMVQRLMLDLGLEHGRAGEITEGVLALELPVRRRRRHPRLRPRLLLHRTA